MIAAKRPSPWGVGTEGRPVNAVGSAHSVWRDAEPRITIAIKGGERREKYKRRFVASKRSLKSTPVLNSATAKPSQKRSVVRWWEISLWTAAITHTQIICDWIFHAKIISADPHAMGNSAASDDKNSLCCNLPAHRVERDVVENTPQKKLRFALSHSATI